MINAPTAKALLEIKQSANVVIWDYQSYFEITIDSKEIAPQRMTNPPQRESLRHWQPRTHTLDSFSSIRAIY